MHPENSSLLSVWFPPASKHAPIFSFPLFVIAKPTRVRENDHGKMELKEKKKFASKNKKNSNLSISCSKTDTSLKFFVELPCIRQLFSTIAKHLSPLAPLHEGGLCLWLWRLTVQDLWVPLVQACICAWRMANAEQAAGTVAWPAGSRQEWPGPLSFYTQLSCTEASGGHPPGTCHKALLEFDHLLSSGSR